MLSQQQHATTDAIINHKVYLIWFQILVMMDWHTVEWWKEVKNFIRRTIFISSNNQSILDPDCDRWYDFSYIIPTKVSINSWNLLVSSLYWVDMTIKEVISRHILLKQYIITSLITVFSSRWSTNIVPSKSTWFPMHTSA